MIRGSFTLIKFYYLPPSRTICYLCQVGDYKLITWCQGGLPSSYTYFTGLILLLGAPIRECQQDQAFFGLAMYES